MSLGLQKVISTTHIWKSAFIIKRDIMKLSHVIQTFENFAPTSLAESWDNVGLLIEPTGDATIKKILFTNDLTEPVLNEALSSNCNLIVSYHPPIFKPLKRLTQSTWKERVIVKCLENQVALYSPHTSWDSYQGGVNDWLLQPFDLKSSLVLEGTKTSSSQARIVSHCKDKLTKFIDLGLHQGLLSEPFYSVKNSDCQESLVRVTCGKKNDLMLLQKEFDDIIIWFSSSSQQETSSNTGCGRIAQLKLPITLGDALSTVKKHLKLQHLQLCVGNGKGTDCSISSIAVCAGSGNLLRNVKADLLITGEMSHHDLLDAHSRGVSVILTCHSNSERGFLSFIIKKIKLELDRVDPANGIELIVSNVDRDPLITV